MNIIYHSGQALVTDKETFPTKPTLNHDATLVEHSSTGFQNRLRQWEKEVADFIRDCTPIREEDQVIVRDAIRRTYQDGKLVKRTKTVVDHTIYKVDIQLREVRQFRYNRSRVPNPWIDMVGGSPTDSKNREYRRAFTVVETKES